MSQVTKLGKDEAPLAPPGCATVAMKQKNSINFYAQVVKRS